MDPCCYPAGFCEGFVSDSPDLPSFAALNTIHEQLQEVELTRSMLSIDYSLSKRTLSPPAKWKSAAQNGLYVWIAD